MKNIIFVILICLSTQSCNQNSSLKNNGSTQWWTDEDRTLIVSELNRTTEALNSEIEDLSIDQWHFKETPTRWSISEIVEHLEMQNQLHYREISVTSLAPQYLKFREITVGQDAHFTKYSTDTTKGKARWFLEPRGKYNSVKNGMEAFAKARSELTKFVEQTDIDLRKQFTFRIPVEGKDIQDIKIGQVRDLHQLLLTGIAHTDRHLTQIQNIKKHPEYPK